MPHFGDQGDPIGLVQSVLRRRAEQVAPPLEQGGHEQRDAARVEDRVFHGHLYREHVSRPGGRHFDIRYAHHGEEIRRRVEAHVLEPGAILPAEANATDESGYDVVRMPLEGHCLSEDRFRGGQSSVTGPSRELEAHQNTGQRSGSAAAETSTQGYLVALEDLDLQSTEPATLEDFVERPGHHVPGGIRELLRPLARDGEVHPSVLVPPDPDYRFVFELQSHAHNVESRPEIPSRGRDAHVDLGAGLHQESRCGLRQHRSPLRSRSSLRDPVLLCSRVSSPPRAAPLGIVTHVGRRSPQSPSTFAVKRSRRVTKSSWSMLARAER